MKKRPPYFLMLKNRIARMRKFLELNGDRPVPNVIMLEEQKLIETALRGLEDELPRELREWRS